MKRWSPHLCHSRGRTRINHPCAKINQSVKKPKLVLSIIPHPVAPALRYMRRLRCLGVCSARASLVRKIAIRRAQQSPSNQENSRPAYSISMATPDVVYFATGNAKKLQEVSGGDTVTALVPLDHKDAAHGSPGRVGDTTCHFNTACRTSRRRGCSPFLRRLCGVRA
jgi:hypothetical protein